MKNPTTDPWVLLPGTLCTSDVFAPVMDHLGVPAENRHAIELKSPHLQDYKAPLRAAVADGAIVCGFSLGAMIVAHNLDAVARAKAIVLLASNPFPDPPGNRANRETVRDRVLGGGARDWVIENWHLMSGGSNPECLDRVISMAERTSDLIAAQTELAASRPGAAGQLEACDLPLVFVSGSADQLTPPDLVRPITQRAARAMLVIPERLGHFALLEAPDQVASAITNGLNAVLPKTNLES